MKRLASLLTLAAVCLALPACHKTAPNPAGPGGKESGAKPLRLAFVSNNAADFWTIARSGCNSAAQALGNVTVDFQIPSDGTAGTQKRIVDDLLARGVDGIAISAIDPANQVQMLNDAARQCLLITQDSDAPASDRACYIGTDNLAAGRQAGELLKQALPDGGKVVVFVGSMDTQNARERFGGIKEVIAGTKIELVETRTDDTDRVRAKANALDALVKYPDLAAMVGLWAYNGPAILNAIKESNKAGAVKIVCFDEEDETLQGIRDGAVFATVVQQPYEFGSQAMRLMAQVLRGDKAAIPADKRIIIQTLPVNRDNVADFSARLKNIRGR